MPTLMGSINIIARCARLYRNDRLKKYGIHGTMDTIILHVCKNPGISQEELAKSVCIDKSSVTRKVAKLEEKGFITRKASEKDRRVQLVFPTDKGTELCGEIKSILREWNAEMTGGLSQRESEQLLCGLMTILDRAKNYAAEREETLE